MKFILGQDCQNYGAWLVILFAFSVWHLAWICMAGRGSQRMVAHDNLIFTAKMDIVSETQV